MHQLWGLHPVGGPTRCKNAGTQLQGLPQQGSRVLFWGASGEESPPKKGTEWPAVYSMDKDNNLQKGTLAHLVAVPSRPDLGGATAKLIAYIETEGKWKVECRKEVLNIPPANLGPRQRTLTVRTKAATRLRHTPLSQQPFQLSQQSESSQVASHAARFILTAEG